MSDTPSFTRLSDVSQVETGTRLRVAGRIISRDAQQVVLGDATGLVRAHLSSEVSMGALVALEGLWSAGVLEQASVVATFPVRRRPAAEDSEAVRLSRRGGRIAKNLALRARVLREVRSYFDHEGFLEVETPLVVPSPGLDPHLFAVQVSSPGPERFLITSPEYQMKRLLVGGLDRIYQVCRCFRNDEQGALHEPEFTMLEWYRAYAGVEDVMRDTEQLVAQVATRIHGRPVVFHGEREIDVTPPWPRVTVREACQWFAGVEMESLLSDEDLFFRALVETIEPALESIGAVHLCEYPLQLASLARPKPSDPSVAERFEAYLAGIELCNGFGELTCPDEQRKRLEIDQVTRETRGLPVYPIDQRFVAALEEGMPPSGGNALGLDRLVMLIAGAEHIEEVLAVPSRWL
jgi:lysyl-tRNA synthetase class 2